MIQHKHLGAGWDGSLTSPLGAFPIFPHLPQEVLRGSKGVSLTPKTPSSQQSLVEKIRAGTYSSLVCLPCDLRQVTFPRWVPIFASVQMKINTYLSTYSASATSVAFKNATILTPSANRFLCYTRADLLKVLPHKVAYKTSPKWEVCRSTMWLVQ
jgi:hypothetical protein